MQTASRLIHLSRQCIAALVCVATTIGAVAAPLCIARVSAPVLKAAWKPLPESKPVEVRVTVGDKVFTIASRNRQTVEILEPGGRAIQSVKVPREAGERISELVTGPNGWLWIQTSEQTLEATLRTVDGMPRLESVKRIATLFREQCNLLRYLVPCSPVIGHFYPGIGQAVYTGYRESFLGFAPVETHVVGPNGHRKLGVPLDPHDMPYSLPGVGGVLVRSLDDLAMFYDGQRLQKVVPDQKPSTADLASSNDIRLRTWNVTRTSSGRELITNFPQSASASASALVIELGPGPTFTRLSGLPPSIGPIALNEVAGAIVTWIGNGIWIAEDSTFRLAARIEAGAVVKERVLSEGSSAYGFSISGRTSGSVNHYSISRHAHGCLTPRPGHSEVIID